MTKGPLQWLRPVIAAGIGLVLGLLLTLFIGENPITVAGVLFRSAFGSAYDFGMTLFYSVPLILTGLSVAVSFRAGLFNVGAEGQLLMGSLACAAVGALAPQLPFPLSVITAGLAGFLVGAGWGAIPGWLRARRGTHEVISTILLNFVAAGIVSWVTLYFLRNPDSQNPETVPLGDAFLLNQWPIFDKAPVSHALTIAIVAALIVGWVLSRTVLGYRIRVTGQNAATAKAHGIPVAKTQILAMAWSGGLAGLVGIAEVLGNAGRFRPEFSPGFGFTGIAVALLVRGNPLAVIPAALLFGALHKGSMDLDLETDRVTRDFAVLLQALVILAVSAEAVIRFKFKKRKAASEQELRHG